MSKSIISHLMLMIPVRGRMPSNYIPADHCRSIGKGSLRKNMVLAIGVVFALTAFMNVAKAVGKGNLIVYGGMGHLSNKAQPVFGSVFEGKVPAAKNFRRDTEAFLGKLISQSKFSWTNDPVIFDYEDANTIMKRVYSTRSEKWDKLRPSMDQLLEEFDRVYVLAIVADFELNVKSPPISNNSDYLNLLTASVTAVLVDMSTKEVILSDNHLEPHLQETSDNFLSKSEVSELLLLAYKKAAGAAVLKLADKMKRVSPSDAFDRHMVTGTIFPDPRAQAMFDLEPWGKQVESVCALPVQCGSDSSICFKLAALTTSVTSRAMSDAGQLMLPPVGWTYWADRSTNLISLRLLQPRGSILEETLAIKIPPESAEVKVIAEMHVAEPRVVRNTGDDASKAVWIGTRYDKALLNVRRFETEYDNCKKVTFVPALISAEGTNASLVTANFQDLERDIERLYVFKAILDAGDKLIPVIKKSIKGD